MADGTVLDSQIVSDTIAAWDGDPLQADFNRLNHGRLVLSRLAIHEHTLFADLAATGDRILFVHGEDIVEGKLVEDPSDLIDRCMTFHRVGMTTAYASPLEASRLPSEVTAR